MDFENCFGMEAQIVSIEKAVSKIIGSQKKDGLNFCSHIL